MNTVTLLDGRVVDSACEDWRHETEARFIAALPTLQRRREWLRDVATRRGEAHAERLRGAMRAIWDRARHGAAPVVSSANRAEV